MSHIPAACYHEYVLLSDRLARVTASISSDPRNSESVFHALKVAAARDRDLDKGSPFVPLRSSFKWLDNTHTSVVGFVYAANEVAPITEATSGRMREMAANLYLDKSDESLWEVREGAGSKYLARRGAEDLSAMLEHARSSPRGSTPRMHSVVQASVSKPHEFVTFVFEGASTADVDSGVSMGADGDTTLVLSHMTRQLVSVPSSYIVSQFQLDTEQIPQLDRRQVAGAGTVLTPQEYWTKQYSYNPAYLAKVLEQVNQMAAA